MIRNPLLRLVRSGKASGSGAESSLLFLTFRAWLFIQAVHSTSAKKNFIRFDFYDSRGLPDAWRKSSQYYPTGLWAAIPEKAYFLKMRF
jgi:hypothetical protein